ncbi:MAG: hypothetical protein ABI700_23610, partial [Chloroflexota bacterium]
EMMLRGALEYDHDIETWWNKLNDDSRRLVALHALLSESAPARVRALQRLETLPDAETPQIPRLVAQQLQVETNAAAQLAAIRVLEVRGKPPVIANDGENSLMRRLQLSSPYDWRESAFTPEIDALLAQEALDTTKPEVAEAAARAIGRIRSETAVKVLAEHQLKGERHALRALALVRDEAPSLPKSVSQQARLYTWLNNTWRRLTDHPIRSVTRYLFAAIFAGIAMWWYAYSEISGAALFFAERWGKSLTSGITFGVIFGLVVLLGAEVPERLRGFWPWWSRLLLSALLGFLTGALVWIVFELFFLYNPISSYDSIAVGAIGAALSFAVSVIFDAPAWVAVVWAALMTYLPLYLTWAHDNHYYSLIFTRPETPETPASVFGPAIPGTPAEHINQYAIVIALLIALGAYLPMLIADGRKLYRRVRASRTAGAS